MTKPTPPTVGQTGIYSGFKNKPQKFIIVSVEGDIATADYLGKDGWYRTEFIWHFEDAPNTAHVFDKETL